MCHILFIHTILGCATTSRAMKLAKGPLCMKMFLVNNHFHDQAKVLNSASASKKDVVAANDLRVTCLTIYFLKITA